MLKKIARESVCVYVCVGGGGGWRGSGGTGVLT